MKLQEVLIPKTPKNSKLVFQEELLREKVVRGNCGEETGSKSLPSVSKSFGPSYQHS